MTVETPGVVPPAGGAAPTGPAGVTAGALADELADVVKRGAEEAGVPGVAVGLHAGGEEVVVSHGVTNVEHPLAVDDRTLFQIGSTTKTFTAAAVMALVQDDRLGLDDPVAAHLGAFRLAAPGEGEAVTVRHLLTHTGGWAGDWFLLTEPDYGRDGALARVVQDMWRAPRLAAPGQLYSYNNAGYYVLGRLLEVLTGWPYPEAVRRLVLEPAGIGHSFFHADEMITHRVAAGHVASEDGPRVQRPWPRPFYAWPAGALCSCAGDQLSWARLWLAGGVAADGSRLLRQETVAAMTTPQVGIDSTTDVGLAWMIRRVGGATVVEHGGATNGYLSRFVMCPAAGMAVTVLSNSGAAGAFNRSIERWALGKAAGAVEADSGPATGSLDTAACVGRYGLGPEPEWTHSVELDPDDSSALVMTPGTPGTPSPPPRYRLVPCGEDEVICVDPPAAAGQRGVFGRGADGAVAWLRFGLRVYNRAPGPSVP
ncbi:MAG TPA: serine hydrolase domain-containing protein [Acidimicrobiales bacterium]|nr:serine hydrolase domain-containing protein [Acidimicrobiales bacterium]